MLDGWSKRSFARDIRAAAPFLFDQYRGKIAEFPRPEAHDPNQSYVCIATSSLIFEFSEWRGEKFGRTCFAGLLAARFLRSLGNTACHRSQGDWFAIPHELASIRQTLGAQISGAGKCF
jgi:hypothetical protein